VSLGPEPVTVPNLEGKTHDEAKALLDSAGLALGPDAATEHSETIAAGNIIRAASTEPKVLPGTAIAVVVSDGPAPRALPADVIGQPYDAAAAKLQQLGVAPVRVDVYSDTVANGMVIGFKSGDGATDLAPGAEVPRDSQVQVVVSKGHAPVKVPDVSGMFAPDAVRALSQLGFVVYIDGDATKRVLATEPLANTEAPYGSKVTLVMAGRN
jgi:serine/threonine-protein kinase